MNALDTLLDAFSSAWNSSGRSAHVVKSARDAITSHVLGIERERNEYKRRCAIATTALRSLRDESQAAYVRDYIDHRIAKLEARVTA